MKTSARIFTVAALTCICIAAAAKPAFRFKSYPHVMNVTENSFTVLFESEENAMCWIEVAPDDGSEWYQSERPKYYQNVSGRHMMGKLHKITIAGLEPGTTYRYRVMGTKVLESGQARVKWGDSFAWKPQWGKGYHSHVKYCTVKTLDSKASSCRFSMVCDMHFNDTKYSTLIGGMPEDDDFIVLCGDIVSHSNNIDTVIRHTFQPIARQASMYPVFYARGNHESRGADWYKLPERFPTPTGEFYYIFRQGPVGFIVLDAGEDKPDTDIEYSGTAAFDEYRAAELEWIRKAVEEPAFKNAPVKVCISHIPTKADKKSWYCEKWITDNFAPVLEKAGLDLMLSGHHHNYKWDAPGQAGCAYPILINSNKDRLDFTCEKEGGAWKVTLRTFGLDGTASNPEVSFTVK